MGALASAVREDRLWQRHADMAKLGGTPRGGVNRQALSAEDAAARSQLAACLTLAQPCREHVALGLNDVDLVGHAGAVALFRERGGVLCRAHLRRC